MFKVLNSRRLLGTPNGIRIPTSCNTMSSSRNYTAQAKSDPDRVYVLGTGNIGRLYAHALAIAPQPAPVTLLFHRHNLLKEWEEAGSRIDIDGISRFIPNVPTSSNGYGVEVIGWEDGALGKSRPKIRNLIVATKAYNTVEALKSIRGRLDHQTTLLFAQNGVGVTEDVERHVLKGLEEEVNVNFNVRKAKANYLRAITTHGLYSTGPFRSVLAGYGDIVIGHQYAEDNPKQSKYLLETIINAPLLNARAIPQEQFMTSIYQKLVVNSTINPLSAVFQRKNGDLFNHKPIYELMRLLVEEMCPILATKMGTKEELSQKRLEELVISVAEKTAQNNSSMLQDFRAGITTEIQYLNGWFLHQAGHSRTHCNRILFNMVMNGMTLQEDQICKEFGLEWWQDEEADQHLRIATQNVGKETP